MSVFAQLFCHLFSTIAYSNIETIYKRLCSKCELSDCVEASDIVPSPVCAFHKMFVNFIDVNYRQAQQLWYVCFECVYTYTWEAHDGGLRDLVGQGNIIVTIMCVSVSNLCVFWLEAQVNFGWVLYKKHLLLVGWPSQKGTQCVCQWTTDQSSWSRFFSFKN